jgi:hypothetical protein
VDIFCDGNADGQQLALRTPATKVVDRKRAQHIKFSAAIGDSENFAPKEELQSVKDVVYDHAQKLACSLTLVKG